MLAFTRKTDYALIALTHMAQHPNECNSAREIAGRYGVPLPLLMNILKLMTQQGLAQSVRGPRGGYRLAAPPEKINLNDIIEAIEGPVQLVQCVDWYENKSRGKLKTGCDLMAACPVRPTISRVHDRLVEFLATVTLADVVDNQRPGRDQRPGADGAAEPIPARNCSSVSGECSCEAIHLPG
ncbi:MAG: Rrf2 family transcriptional regulator [Planctomycetes bacterium]|nr:Rrf2 family transcriptional regulator [Planctomycetota bacterium]